MILQTSRFSLVLSQYYSQPPRRRTEFIVYRRDQRRSGLNYARPCRECVDNIMRIFFPHECPRDADGMEWVDLQAKDSRARALDKEAPSVIFRNIHSRDTPLVIRRGKSKFLQGARVKTARLSLSSTYYPHYTNGPALVLASASHYARESRRIWRASRADPKRRAGTIKFILAVSARGNCSVTSPLRSFAIAD